MSPLLTFIIFLGATRAFEQEDLAVLDAEENEQLRILHDFSVPRWDLVSRLEESFAQIVGTNREHSDLKSFFYDLFVTNFSENLDFEPIHLQDLTDFADVTAEDIIFNKSYDTMFDKLDEFDSIYTEYILTNEFDVSTKRLWFIRDFQKLLGDGISEDDSMDDNYRKKLLKDLEEIRPKFTEKLTETEENLKLVLDVRNNALAYLSDLLTYIVAQSDVHRDKIDNKYKKEAKWRFDQIADSMIEVCNARKVDYEERLADLELMIKQELEYFESLETEPPGKYKKLIELMKEFKKKVDSIKPANLLI